MESDDGGYDVIELQTWPEKIACDFINKTIKNANQRNVKRLVAELGCHPLGIKHSVSFIKQSNISLDEYLNDLKEHKIDVLSEKVAIGHGISVSVFSSFSITIKKLHHEEPDRAKMMSLLGVLDGSFIDQQFLERFTKKKWKCKKSLQLLKNHFIVQTHQRKNEFNNKITKFITVHSLYQEAIKIFLTNNGMVKETVELCMKMMTQKPKENYEMYFWRNQLEYLWKQNCFQKIVVHTFSSFPEILILKHLFSFSSTQEDISRKIYESRKNDKSDVILYFAEYYLAIYSSQFDSILKRLKENVSPGEGKSCLINLIETCFNFESENIFSAFHQGHFHQTIEEYEKPSLIKRSQLNLNWFLSYCLKELGRYDEALDILYEEPEFKHFLSISEVQIGCCWILKGDVKKGLNIIRTVPEIENHLLSIADVGRALFKVGCIEQSKQYFEKLLSLGLKKNDEDSHSYLDAICMAMQILHVKNSLLFGCIFSPVDGNSSTLKIRWQFLYYCNLVKANEFTEAENYANDTITKQIEDKEYTGYVFREILMMAYHWKMHYGYYKALMVFQMINKLKEKVHNHKRIIEPIDMQSLDVQDNIDVCIKNWRKIFRL